MLPLVAYILSATTFQQLFRLGQHRGVDIRRVAAANYVVAAVLNTAWYCLRADSNLAPAWDLIALGGVNGMLYYAHLLLILAAYRIAGVGITIALASIAATAPVLLSWVAWHEPITWAQWAAVALLPVAMALMRPDRGAPGRLGLRADLVLIGVFLGACAVLSIHKWASIRAGAADASAYNMALFVAAALCSTGHCLRQRTRVAGIDLWLGGVIGMVNTANLLLVLVNLAVLPAVVFFPVASSLMIVLNLVLSYGMWHEHIRRRQVVGIALAIIVVCLATAVRAA